MGIRVIVMIIRRFFTLALAVVLMAGAGTMATAAANNGGTASGEVDGGIRLIRLPASGADLHLTVYRGDYVKFLSDPAATGAVLFIPSMGVETTLSTEPDTAPLHKMKSLGSFPFNAGETAGVLEVVAFENPRYRELTALQAEALIRSKAPLVLDVRTRQEYGRGHLAGSVLIPVQELQHRLGELSAYRDREILIYCATGNRSTVAAKILLDAGFMQVANMRHGIADWWRERLPIVR
jgi:rhodanese-related sulfurtransferase